MGYGIRSREYYAGSLRYKPLFSLRAHRSRSSMMKFRTPSWVGDSASASRAIATSRAAMDFQFPGKSRNNGARKVSLARFFPLA